MKRLLVGLVTLCLSAWAVAGETWKRNLYESGESVYYSNNLISLVSNPHLIISERGVGLLYLPGMTSQGLSRSFCFIQVDDKPEEKCEIDFTFSPLLKHSTALANQISNANKAKIRLRSCAPQAIFCDYAVDGGSSIEINWEWDEPLTTTFPDFKPYKVK